MARQETMYAANWSDRVGRYCSVFMFWNRAMVSTCGGPHEPVQVEEVPYGEPEGPYWAWEDWTRDQRPWRMVQCSLPQLEMCSPDEFRSAIADGQGRIVNLRPVPATETTP